MKKRTQVFVGEVVGNLTVLSLSHRQPVSGVVQLMWNCRCECGAAVVRSTSNLHKSGVKTHSCKACANKLNGAHHVIHNGCGTRLHAIWHGMKHRCDCETATSYKWYGAKGVRVCAEWQDFEVFRKWAMSHGYADQLTIERNDSSRDYEPDNCEWVTRSENSRRARVGVGITEARV